MAHVLRVDNHRSRVNFISVSVEYTEHAMFPRFLEGHVQYQINTDFFLAVNFLLNSYFGTPKEKILPVINQV
jgi:hypothetical protein